MCIFLGGYLNVQPLPSSRRECTLGNQCITEFRSFAVTLNSGSSLDWSTWCACLCLKRTKALEEKALASPEEDRNIPKSRTFLPIHDNYCTVHCAALLLPLLFHQMSSIWLTNNRNHFCCCCWFSGFQRHMTFARKFFADSNQSH